jgi:glycolate dehydrogenase iron-sulfur subunit
MKNSNPLSDTDLCVMCGMCIPHCPTYQLYQTEAESPRGRIALIQSIANKRTSPNKKVIRHIDHCLGCLNCQTICPSQVPFGNIIDEFRTRYNSSIPKPLSSQFILKCTRNINGLEKFKSTLSSRFLRKLLQPLMRLAKIPAIPPHHESGSLLSLYKTQITPSRGSIHLFTGCIGKLTDTQTILDTSFLLNKLGYDVKINQEQLCCGATHLHNGKKGEAQKLQLSNHTAFDALDSKAVLFFSPACGSLLKSTDSTLIQDARSFIFAAIQEQNIAFAPLTLPVALHESCAHRSLSTDKKLNTKLLDLIPELNIIESDEPTLCCGAGGLQSINYPSQAASLLKRKMASFDLAQTEIILSDNIGCSLHIDTSLSAYNKRLHVLHPLSLLARQWPQDD